MRRQLPDSLRKRERTQRRRVVCICKVVAELVSIQAGQVRKHGDPNRLTWGLLVQAGQAQALRAWWLVLFPGLALALTSVGLTLLAIDPADRANFRRLSSSD